MSDVVRLEYAYGVCPKCKSVHSLQYLIRSDGLIHKPYEIKCINCNSYFAKEEILRSGEETTPKPITNADRIRSMTDEELAEVWWEIVDCGECAPGCGSCNMTEKDCKYWVLAWLKQEAVSDG